MPRKYQQSRRAERTQATRDSIVQATVDLHGTLGPAYTTISAIAEKAGVRRATVYEHFPDEHAIFDACTNLYFTQHPPPDHQSWLSVPDPLARLAAGLHETYAYYQDTEAMTTLALRDAALKPMMWEMKAAQEQRRHWQDAEAVLLAPFQPPPDLLAAAVRHALNFATWQSLVRGQGLDDRQAVALMTALVRCLWTDA